MFLLLPRLSALRAAWLVWTQHKWEMSTLDLNFFLTSLVKINTKILGIMRHDLVAKNQFHFILDIPVQSMISLNTWFLRYKTNSWDAQVNFSTQIKNLIFWSMLCINSIWPCGLMDKASDFGSEDCRFESCHGRYGTISKFWDFWYFLLSVSLSVCIWDNDIKNFTVCLMKNTACKSGSLSDWLAGHHKRPGPLDGRVPRRRQHQDGPHVFHQRHHQLRTRAGEPGVQAPPQVSSCTGRHIRLSQTSRWHHNETFVLKSTGGSSQPDVSPCIEFWFMAAGCSKWVAIQIAAVQIKVITIKHF